MNKNSAYEKAASFAMSESFKNISQDIFNELMYGKEIAKLMKVYGTKEIMEIMNTKLFKVIFE
jgi:hypothetical protein